MPKTPRLLLNAYYLQEEATRALRRGEGTAGTLSEVFAEAQAAGATVIRTNAHNDDACKVHGATRCNASGLPTPAAGTNTEGTAIQIAPRQYDEVSLQGLDAVLRSAHEHGIQLLLILGNHWNAYGGARRYVGWHYSGDVSQGDPRFYTDRTVIDHFKGAITDLLNRTLDGVRYGDHPAVFGWELLNEPRGTGLDGRGEQLRAWIDEVAAQVASLSSRPVGLGCEGLDIGYEGYDRDAWRRVKGSNWLFEARTSFRLNVQSPHIDFASAHFYPEAWFGLRDDLGALGVRWIAEHAAIAREAGKALVVGELGLRHVRFAELANQSGKAYELLASADRAQVLDAWLACGERSGVQALGPWLFIDDERKAGWDAYSFRLGEGTTDQAYAEVLHRYGQAWSQGKSPAAHDTNLASVWPQ